MPTSQSGAVEQNGPDAATESHPLANERYAAIQPKILPPLLVLASNGGDNYTGNSFQEPTDSHGDSYAEFVPVRRFRCSIAEPRFRRGRPVETHERSASDD